MVPSDLAAELSGRGDRPWGWPLCPALRRAGAQRRPPHRRAGVEQGVLGSSPLQGQSGGAAGCLPPAQPAVPARHWGAVDLAYPKYHAEPNVIFPGGPEQLHAPGSQC